MKKSTYINIKNPEIGGLISLTDATLLLSRLKESYKSYITFESNEAGLNLLDKKGELIREAELVITDLKQSSMELAYEPYASVLGQTDMVGSADSSVELFNSYNEDVLFTDYTNFANLTRITDKYSREQVQKIYNPILNIVRDGYVVKVKNENNQQSIQYDKKIILAAKDFLKENSNTEEKNSDTKFGTALVEFDANSEFSKDSIKKIVKLNKPALNSAKWESSIIYFKDSIVYEVEHADNAYIITYRPWGICVVEVNYDEALELFNEQIHFLYRTYVLEEDNEKLTKDAYELKMSIKESISNVIGY